MRFPFTLQDKKRLDLFYIMIVISSFYSLELFQTDCPVFKISSLTDLKLIFIGLKASFFILDNFKLLYSKSPYSKNVIFNVSSHFWFNSILLIYFFIPYIVSVLDGKSHFCLRFESRLLLKAFSIANA